MHNTADTETLAFTRYCAWRIMRPLRWYLGMCFSCSSSTQAIWPSFGENTIVSHEKNKKKQHRLYKRACTIFKIFHYQLYHYQEIIMCLRLNSYFNSFLHHSSTTNWRFIRTFCYITCCGFTVMLLFTPCFPQWSVSPKWLAHYKCSIIKSMWNPYAIIIVSTPGSERGREIAYLLVQWNGISPFWGCLKFCYKNFPSINILFMLTDKKDKCFNPHYAPPPTLPMVNEEI